MDVSSIKFQGTTNAIEPLSNCETQILLRVQGLRVIANKLNVLTF